MADALKLRLLLFKYLSMDATSLSTTNVTLDGLTDELGIVFQVEEAITITQVGIRIQTITGTPGELTISLNSVDLTTGVPSSTILGGGSPASVAIASPSASFTAGQFYWATLTNSYTAARGDVISIKVDPTGGTWDASNSVAVAVSVSGLGERIGMPYTAQAPSGVWSKLVNLPIYGIRSSSDTQGQPLESISSALIDSGTNPNQVGFAFTLPAAWGSTFKVSGIMIILAKQVSANQTYDLVLYDTDGTTELQAVTLDSEYFATTATPGAYRVCELYFDESTLSTLNFGSKYYVMIRPNTASGDVTVYSYTVRQASDMQAYPLGENCFYATKVNTATAPVDVTTQRPYVGLILNDITEPSSGGGLLTHSGMSGGLVG